jgi:Ca2+-binding EF-hand superfamily protein
MKKLMLGFGVAAIIITAASPSFAREVKEIVGYVKTETTYNDRDAEFHKADKSGDGAINFGEFQNAAVLENEFEMFDMNDTNDDQLLTIEEFRNFSKFGPARTADGPSMTSYNFNQKPSDK